MLYFDEYNEWFRFPQGAMREGENIRLKILAERGKVRTVKLILKADGGEEREYPMACISAQGSYEVFEVEARLEKADLMWFYFKADAYEYEVCFDGSGRCAVSHAPFQITVYDGGQDAQKWIQGGIIYHIFVDRFRRAGEVRVQEGAILRDDWGGMPEFRPNEKGIVQNNDFFGGNLAGIIEKLPMLAELGVTCVYLSPIFEAASNHKYDTGDYMKIDSSFGDEEIFKTLVSEAAKLGMRIICDGVFNHVGEDSRYFNRYGKYGDNGAYQTKDSPYYPWFNWKNWPESYESWWGIKLLPATNKSDESFKNFITGSGGVLDYWMERGVAGWRLDVVDELADEFLYPLCDAVKRRDSDALIVGEVWEDASNKVSYGKRRRYLLGGQLDSVMNYPLRDAIISYARDGNADAVASTMAWLNQNYPKGILNANMNILGTHDTARILTVLGNGNLPADREGMSRFRLDEWQRREAVWRLKIASILQFTLPGVPCVYYGDEAGMEGCSDPFNRGCYPWEREDSEIYEWFRMLAKIRGSLPAFSGGVYELMIAREGVFVFSRGEGAEKVIVAVNVTNEPYRIPRSAPMLERISGEYQSAPMVLPRGAVILTA